MKIGIVGDIHEDIVALKSAFKIFGQEGCNEVICLGDIVGFKVNAYRYLDTRNAHECIAMVRANCAATVIGNNDLYQLKKLPDFNGGFDFPPDWYQRDYYERKAMSNDRVFLYEDVQLNALMTAEDRSWMDSLPAFITREYEKLRILFSHFAFPDLQGVKAYFPKLSEEFLPHLGFMRQQNCTMGFSGHMHFEGVSICTETGMSRNGFGSYSLREGLQWLFGPCTARCQFNNGVMVLDTQSLQLQAIPLARRIMQEKTDSDHDPRLSEIRVSVAHE
jgi:predicted phosphodiesterase